MEIDAGLLINASPIGMAGASEAAFSPFSESVTSTARVIFGSVAIPVETPLVRLAKSKNKTVINGIEITILQSVEQFALYTGVRPEMILVNEAAAFARA